MFQCFKETQESLVIGAKGCVEIFNGNCKDQSKVAVLKPKPPKHLFGNSLKYQKFPSKCHCLCPCSCSRDLLVVGAPGNSRTEGCVHLYIQPQLNPHPFKLLPSDPSSGNLFGKVAIDCHTETIVVGAPGADAVYIYTKPTGGWTNLIETQKLSSLSKGAQFGSSVAIFSKFIAVGAPNYQQGKGAVFIYTCTSEASSGWQQSAKLVGKAKSHFGASLVGKGCMLVVGAPEEDDVFIRSRGGVYIYQKIETHWVKTQKLIPCDSASFGRFGTSLSYQDCGLVIGAPGNKGERANTGAAYIFKKVGLIGVCWKQVAKLEACNGKSCDQFGSSVSASRDLSTIIVGAPKRDTVYIFTLHGKLWCNRKQCLRLTSSGCVESCFGKSVELLQHI